MEVDARVWFWTPAGMRQSRQGVAYGGYIEVREVERLLEEADNRRRVQMESQSDRGGVE